MKLDLKNKSFIWHEVIRKYSRMPIPLAIGGCFVELKFQMNVMPREGGEEGALWYLAGAYINI